MRDRMTALPARSDAARRLSGADPMPVGLRIVGLACVLAGIVATSEGRDWQPLSLVLALAAVMVVADVISVWTRWVRYSAGSMVQTTMMAVLGPAPAAAIGVLSQAAELPIRVRRTQALDNMIVFGLLGLVGGLLFDAARAVFGLERQDIGYALVVLAVYVLLMPINLGLIVLTNTTLSGREKLRIVRECGLPAIPLELLYGLLAAAAVLVWTHAGLAAAAGLLLLLVVTVPLARTLADALKSGDDLLELRDISDQRAAEVARLASDRERLLSEVLDAEERERARLAESLHDGPMQRLAAARQDVKAGDDGALHQLDAAIAETRSIISAYHPATVRELGFEAALRAAVVPFPSAQSVRLTIESAVDDRELADTMLLPVAQELVVNAVKHARPSAIHVRVAAGDGELVLDVDDDGVGIDAAPEGDAVTSGHLGLAMVRRRVDDAGGRLDIATREDGGTHSRVTLRAGLR
jgi:signal transduction histidine kinase